MHASLSRAAANRALSLSSVTGSGWGGSWISVIDRPPGAFQQPSHHSHPWIAETNWTVFSCQTLIAGDMGKMRMRLLEEDDEGIYSEIQSAAFSPLLRKPNAFQTWQKFMERWIFSKVSRGNAYVLKERDARNVVRALYVLDPDRVTPLVATDGSVYYRLGEDRLSEVPAGAPVVPAGEIMHDAYWCIFHPLVGLPPLFACNLAAIQALEIQNNQLNFFANKSRPSGILLAPKDISDENAKELRDRWAAFRNADAGGVAVLGNDMKYQPLTQNAVDSELVDQLKLSAQMICSNHHVPGYKVGVGEAPKYDNAEVLNQGYYDTCLQTLIVSVQSQLDEGLGLTDAGYCARFDLEDLLAMDYASKVESAGGAVKAGLMAPNEGRKRLNLKKVSGGDTPYLQVQNASLAALDERDKNGPAPAASNTAVAPASADDSARGARLASLAALGAMKSGLSKRAGLHGV